MPTLTRDEMLARFFARDPAFQVEFVVGVVTTGIYCVPTCTARKPSARNVRFFDSVDDARLAGLRACKRCKPDQVHAGHPPGEADRLDLEAALADVRRDPAAFDGVGAFAKHAGFGATKLGELCARHFHATPRTLLAKARIDRAKTMLLGTRRPVVEVGQHVGFESASAFHDNFRATTGLAPRELRALGRTGAFELQLPPGYSTEHILRSIGRDPDGRTERVTGPRLARAVRLSDRPALLTVEFDGRRGGRLARARVEARRALSPTEHAEAHEALLRLLGLTMDPTPFERRARRDASIRRLTKGRKGLRIPQTPNAFEGLVWAIVGQQVNLAFAFTCRNRLIDLCGARAGDGLRAHPTPADVAGLDYADLTKLQFSRRKAEYVIDSARAIASGELALEELGSGSATAAEARLLDVRGLGRWSVRYILMRAFSFLDCVPVGDAGLVNALRGFFDLDARPGPEETEALMAHFAPHRSLASFHLWKTLGDPA